MLFRTIFFSIICSFSFNAVALNLKDEQPEPPTEYSRALLNLVLTIVKDCYKGPKTKGVQLVHCIEPFFKQVVPNPQRYKLYLTGDCPGDVDLIVYNARGDVINCYITLARSVTVHRCISYKIPPLTTGEELSITPPRVLIK